jgi:hypothetical protein
MPSWAYLYLGTGSKQPGVVGEWRRRQRGVDSPMWVCPQRSELSRGHLSWRGGVDTPQGRRNPRCGGAEVGLAFISCRDVALKK